MFKFSKENPIIKQRGTKKKGRNLPEMPQAKQRKARTGEPQREIPAHEPSDGQNKKFLGPQRVYKFLATRLSRRAQ
jgi:hypothetical protein